MSGAVLTVVDTAGIQRYIFGSNHLRENVGASYLVEQATRRWPLEAVATVVAETGHQSNVADAVRQKLDPDRKLEDGLGAEVVYVGGGNAVILFASLQSARRFAWNLSRRVLIEAPGLEIVIAHSPEFDWSPTGHGLREVAANTFQRVDQKKRSHQATPLAMLGLGVTAECSSTGKAAWRTSIPELEPEPGDRAVSRETWAKLASVKPARYRLIDLLPESLRKDDDLIFPDEMDNLGGTTGEERYVAVVHVDGNDMGGHLRKIAEGVSHNRDYINRLRGFSHRVEEAAEGAIVDTLNHLRANIRRPDQSSEQSGWHVCEVVPQPRDKGADRANPRTIPLGQESEGRGYPKKPCWPFRPIVFGGDDLTFVCAGQLGLSLATLYMEAFIQQTRSLLGEPIHTGGGVCVVKMHYPFNRAYDLSAQLAGNAKTFLGDERNRNSALDWHFSTTGLAGTLDAIRGREYQGPQDWGALVARPVRLENPKDWRSWENFTRLVATFNYGDEWSGRRNKLKDLRTALREGPDAVREFVTFHRLNRRRNELPRLSGAPDAMRDRGWAGRDACGYFDGLEAMDHHILLEEVQVLP